MLKMRLKCIIDYCYFDENGNFNRRNFPSIDYFSESLAPSEKSLSL